MATQPTATHAQPQWQQPDFDHPTYVGPVLLAAESVPLVLAPGVEETRWRLTRRWLFPLVLVAGLITGAWWQFIVIGIVVSVVLKRRVRELTAQRYALSRGSAFPSSGSDLR